MIKPFALRIDAEDMHRAVSWLKKRGLQPSNFLKDGTEQPMVFAWMPAVAIYFDDPDGHSLEFIAPLDDDANPDLGLVAWDKWEQMFSKYH